MSSEAPIEWVKNVFRAVADAELILICFTAHRDYLYLRQDQTYWDQTY